MTPQDYAYLAIQTAYIREANGTTAQAQALISDLFASAMSAQPPTEEIDWRKMRLLTKTQPQWRA